MVEQLHTIAPAPDFSHLESGVHQIPVPVDGSGTVMVGFGPDVVARQPRRDMTVERRDGVVTMRLADPEGQSPDAEFDVHTPDGESMLKAPVRGLVVEVGHEGETDGVRPEQANAYWLFGSQIVKAALKADKNRAA